VTRTNALLYGVVCLALGACSRPASSSPDAAPAASGSTAASASAHPFAYTGKLEPNPDPVADLVARTYTVTVREDLVHAGTTAGVVSWSYAAPDKPTRLATLVLPGSVSGITAFGPNGSLLAVATGPTGLVIVDAGNVARGRLDRISEAPWKPSERKGCHAAWNTRVASDRAAFVACGTGGIAEVDLSVLARPTVSRSMDVDGYVRDIAVLDASAGLAAEKASPHKLVAAAGAAGLAVVEFPPGGAPRVLSRLPTRGESRSLEVRGGIAYVADGPAGVRIVDLHDPSNPKELATFDPGTVDMARGVAVEGTTLVVCLGDSGVMAMDVSDPAKPKRVAAVDPSRAVNRATVSGKRLFAANDAGGIVVLDLSRPGELRQLHPVEGAKKP